MASALKSTIRTTLITNDYQIPFVDWSVYATVKHFLTYLKPDFHIINGDFLDCYALSKYDKDPELLEQAQGEVETANQILDELVSASPHTITKMTFGNHEERLSNKLKKDLDLWRYLLPADRRPDDIIGDLLSLKDRQINYVPYQSNFNHYGFIVTHGSAAGLNPSKKEIERYGISGVSGHVNRNTTWEIKNHHGHAKWWSLGGLTTHKMDFMPVNNWVHGIGVLSQVVDGELFSFEQIEIANAKFIYDGKVFTPDGVK